MVKTFFTYACMVALVFVVSCKTEKTATTVKDVDGNVYNIVTIGSQKWMGANLKTAHYQDGSAITEVEDSVSWLNIYGTGAQTAAWCYFNSNSANNATYGKLYNWYAVTDPRQLCPSGWHVPSDTEWHTLALTLDPSASWPQTADGQGADSRTAGGFLKSTSSLWLAPNVGATNSSGFSALPSGYRAGQDGHFNGFGNTSYIWSSTPSGNGRAWYRSIQSDTAGIYHWNDFYNLGFSVRCVEN